MRDKGTIMALKRFRCCAICGGAVLSLAAAFATGEAFARGGLSWSPRGYNIFSNYAYTSVWGALMGAGIPHHNLGPPALNMGSPAGGGYYSGLNGGALRTGPHDRMLHPQMLASLPINEAPVYRPPQQSQFSLDPDRASVGEQMQGAYLPPYYHNYNSYWLHGYWGGGMWGWGRWGGDYGIWSFPRWWLGYLYYVTGYGLYANPFLGVAGEQPLAYLDYSQPVQIDLDSAGPAGEGAVDRSRSQVLRTPAQMAGLKAFDAAAAAFKAKNYVEARREIETALQHMPRDPALHEFRALVLFAQQEFQLAAETVYAVLAVSPGWNWTTQSSFFASNDDYTPLLRALEAYCRGRLEAVDARFLLAYHYVTCGHFDAAVKQLATVVRKLPGDELAPHLLTLVSGAVEGEAPARAAAGSAQPALPERPSEVIAVDTAKLLGGWRAERSGIIQIELKLQPDQKFSWTATRAGVPHRIDGAYSVDRDLLLMQGNDGEPLIGFVTLHPGGKLNFRLVGADPADPGLDFTKQ